jgi:acetoin utilization deacetylase AcuC-like enzyme
MKLNEIANVHDQNYLMALESCILSGKSVFMSGDNYVCRDSLDAIRASAGMSRKLANTLIEGGAGFALTRPPGHHAGRAKAEGFCFVNNVAIAAHEIASKDAGARILIVDFDLHHGNGTDSFFCENSSVFYYSIHGAPQSIYPHTGYENEVGYGEGMGYTKNIPLPEGTPGDEWLKYFGIGLHSVAERFRAQYILVSAGFDAHEQDPFSFMKVQDEHYLKACLMLVELAKTQCAGRIGFLLEGGYSLDVMERLVPLCIETLSLNR